MATKLHKQFAHPTPERLKSLITTGKQDKELFKEINCVSKNCETCVRYKKPESRPIVCMPTATEFNDTVAMDLKVFDVSMLMLILYVITFSDEGISTQERRKKELVSQEALLFITSSSYMVVSFTW